MARGIETYGELAAGIQEIVISEEEIQEQKTRFLVPEELADAFSQTDEIVTYDKVLEARITLPDITNTQMETMLSMRERGPQGEAPAALSSSSFTFEGNTDGSSIADFMLGNKELVEGSFYTYQDYLDANPVVMVEKTLAEENGIGVGDVIVADKQAGAVRHDQADEPDRSALSNHHAHQKRHDQHQPLPHAQQFHPAASGQLVACAQ